MEVGSEVGSSENSGRAALIVNTRSRSGERAYSEAVDRLRDLGVSLGATYALSDPARLPETVREVLDEGLGEDSGSRYDTLILGGGDGSISSVVDFLAHHRTVLGILPLGTANDFARTLGIPSNVQAACEAIAHGKVVDVDLGLIGDNYYVNLASVGLSVGVTQALTPRLKRTAGALAYPLAAVKAFLKHEPFSARLVFPDGDHEAVEIERLLQVGVGNGRFYGGGLIVAPDSSMDDRSLDVYTIEIPRHRDLIGTIRYLILQPHFNGICFRCGQQAGGEWWHIARSKHRSRGSPDGGKNWRLCTRGSPLVSPVQRSGNVPGATSGAY